jgi:ribosomal protein L25 (general stress protein Ctc)
MTTSNKQSDTTITIKTAIIYGEKNLESSIKIDAKDIVNMVKNHGLFIVNKAIQDITDKLYRTTNKKLKEAINVYL